MRLLCIVALGILLLASPTAYGWDETGEAGAVSVVDVALDPGHSRADVGAVGGGLAEYQITLPIALRVKQLLEAQGLTVALSRQDSQPLTDFSDPDPTEQIRLEQEARIAAVGSARVYVSIHLNGYGDSRVRGTEFYYNGDNQGEESRLLADSIRRRLLLSVRAETGYQLPDRGVKEDLSAGKPYGHFFSLRGGMPSVLVETLFLSNPQEAAIMAQEDSRDAFARGIAEGILEYLTPQPYSPGTNDQ